MKFPSIVFLIFNVLGIVLGNVTSSYTICLVIELLCLLVVIFINSKNKLIYFIAILFGIYGSFITVHMKLDTSFSRYKGKNIRINANIISDKTVKNDKYCYVIKTTRVQFKQKREEIARKLLLITDKDLFEDNYTYGKEIYFVGKVKLPTNSRNIGGFNYRTYLYEKNIYGTVFVKSDLIKIGDKTKSNKMLEIGIKLRHKIFKIMDEMLAPRESALLKSMLVGDTQYLSCDMIKKIREYGLAHLLSVSGINIVYIVIIFRSILKLAKIRYRLVNSILIAILGLYVLVVGFTLSLIRATIMTVLSLMGEILFYNSETLSNLIVAALIILIINPFSFYSMGFQFSFIATLSIILFAQKIKEYLEKKPINKVLIEILSVSIAVNIGVLPLEVYYFNKLSLSSILINILISNAHSVSVFAGIIMLIVRKISYILAKPIAILIEIMLKFIFIIAKGLSSIHFLTINIVYIGITGIMVYYSIVLSIFMYKKSDKAKIFFNKYRNIIAGIIMIIILLYNFAPRDFKINFMDVGQGDCILIKTNHNKNILIDGGENINASEIIKNKVTNIDVMIATHGHMDHIGGLINVVNSVDVNKLIIPDTNYRGDMDKLISQIDTRKTHIYKCKSRDNIIIDKDTIIEFLNPDINRELEGENDNSLVFKVKYKDKNFLFTSDITKDCEEKMVSNKLNLRADILKVAHHGSEYSTSEEFVRRVNPKIAVISVGEDNRFNHPSKVVLERLKNNNIEVFRTDECGQIIIATNGKRIRIFRKIINFCR